MEILLPPLNACINIRVRWRKGGLEARRQFSFLSGAFPAPDSVFNFALTTFFLFHRPAPGFVMNFQAWLVPCGAARNLVTRAQLTFMRKMQIISPWKRSPEVYACLHRHHNNQTVGEIDTKKRRKFCSFSVNYLEDVFLCVPKNLRHFVPLFSLSWNFTSDPIFLFLFAVSFSRSTRWSV